MSLEPTSCGDCLVFVGLDDVRLVSLESNEHGLVMTIETTNQLVGCPACGVVARSKGRDRVELVDLPNFGRPTRTIWLKRRFFCPDGDCSMASWTEREGPPVSVPDRRGFGTSVVKAMAERSLNGAVRLDYVRSGMIWRLTCRRLDLPGNRRA